MLLRMSPPHVNRPAQGAPRKPHATGSAFHIPEVPPLLLMPIRMATPEEREKTAAGWTGGTGELWNLPAKREAARDER